MALHDDVAQLLETMAAAGVPPLSEGTPEIARANYDAAAKPVPEDVARVEDQEIPGLGGAVPVRIYASTYDEALPIVVFFHGGGWVLSDIDGHDSLARRLALRSGAIIVSVGYRLAPEHPFPAPFDDAWSVTTWLAANGAQIGGDPARVAVAGDSAGGNLAAAVALRARDEGLRLAFQLLIYPCIEIDADTESMRTNATGYHLAAADMAWFWDHYVPSEHRNNPYAVPARASDLTGLAPALVQTAEFDPLRDEGEQWAVRLREAGVPVTMTRYDGVIHGFVSRWHWIAAGEAAHDEAAAALRKALF